MFTRIPFSYPHSQGNPVQAVKDAMQKHRAPERESITSQDIQKPYDRLNEIIHTMSDQGDGLLEELDDLRDELYRLLR